MDWSTKTDKEDHKTRRFPANLGRASAVGINPDGGAFVGLVQPSNAITYTSSNTTPATSYVASQIRR